MLHLLHCCHRPKGVDTGYRYKELHDTAVARNATEHTQKSPVSKRLVGVGTPGPHLISIRPDRKLADEKDSDGNDDLFVDCIEGT